MNEDFVVVYEFQISLEEFNELLKEANVEHFDPNENNIPNMVFPINTLLADNGISSINKFEVASPKNFIGITVSDKSPDAHIIIRVLVDKNYESAALDVINNKIEYEEPEELKGYEPIEEDE